MKLFIDTSNTEHIIVGLDDKRFESVAKKEKSQKLLSFINEVLKKNKTSIDKIKAIEIVTGPGSFTGLRVGLSVANTIGWVKNIPVNGQNIAKEGPVLPSYEK